MGAIGSDFRENLRNHVLGSEGSLNWSREIWILVKRLLGAASRKYSGSQMIPLVNSRRQRQSNLRPATAAERNESRHAAAEHAAGELERRVVHGAAERMI